MITIGGITQGALELEAAHTLYQSDRKEVVSVCSSWWLWHGRIVQDWLWSHALSISEQGGQVTDPALGQSASSRCYLIQAVALHLGEKECIGCPQPAALGVHVFSPRHQARVPISVTTITPPCTRPSDCGAWACLPLASGSLWGGLASKLLSQVVPAFMGSCCSTRGSGRLN